MISVYIFIFSHLFRFNLRFLYLKWVSYSHHIIEFCFYPDRCDFCLSIGIFMPFSLNTVIDMVGFKSVILLFVFYLYSFCFCFVSCLSLDYFFIFHFIYHLLLCIPYIYLYFLIHIYISPNYRASGYIKNTNN